MSDPFGNLALEVGLPESNLQKKRKGGMGDRRDRKETRQFCANTFRRDTTNVECYADDPPEKVRRNLQMLF